MHDRSMDLRDVAEYLSLSLVSLRKHHRRTLKGVKCYYLGKHVRYMASDIAALLVPADAPQKLPGERNLVNGRGGAGRYEGANVTGEKVEGVA